MMQKNRILLVILAMSIILCCSGIVSAAEPEDYSKIMVIRLSIDHGTVTEQSVAMRYGHPPNPGLQSGDFKGILKTADGKTITAFDVWDPRIQLSDVMTREGNATDLLSGSAVYSDTAEFLLIVPYYKGQTVLELYDKRTGTVLKSVNLSPAIETFTRTYPKDTGGLPVPGSSTNNIWYYLLAGIGLSVLFIFVIITMTRQK